MRRPFAIAVLAAIAALPIGATCVTETRQTSDTTWVGEVTHSGDPVHDAYVFTRIFDAANREFFTEPDFRARVCPSTLMPGTVGGFQLDIDTADIYSAGLLPPQLPLHAEFSPVAPGAPGVGPFTSGIFAPRITGDDGASTTVEIENDSDIPYSDFEVCGIARSGGNAVTRVAFADAVGFPELLKPGEVVTMTLPVGTPSDGASVQLYIQHVPRPPTPYCCGNEPPADWQRLDAGDAFSVAAPPGWTYTPLQGIDSFVGAFEGDGIRITFDYGWYSSLGAFEGDPAFSFSTDTIDGYDATFATPKAARPGLTGALVEIDDMTSLSMHAFDLTPEQQELVFAIFRSLEVTR